MHNRVNNILKVILVFLFILAGFYSLFFATNRKLPTARLERINLDFSERQQCQISERLWQNHDQSRRFFLRKFESQWRSDFQVRSLSLKGSEWSIELFAVYDADIHALPDWFLEKTILIQQKHCITHKGCVYTCRLSS